MGGESLQIAFRLKDLPVYPIYDEMDMSPSHSCKQLFWLLENGTLYRVLPMRIVSLAPYVYQSQYQEMCYRYDTYHFLTYAPEYRGEKHDESLVKVRKYETMAGMFANEHIRNIGGCLPDEYDTGWKWTEREPALAANGGSLV